MSRVRTRLTSLLTVRVRPVQGTVLGLVGVAIVAVAFGLVHDASLRVIEALVLVVPVIFAALVGGQRASSAVAMSATLAFAFIIPPFGRPDVELTEDLVALGVFLAVALVVGSLVAGRVEALGHLEEQRNLLLRSVSHDFRTPLAVISAATSDLMASPDYDDATRDHLHSLVLDETQRLDRLVANLLDLSRLQSAGFRPTLQSVDIGELVEHVTGRLRRILLSVDLQVEVAAGLPAVPADFTQLDQVLTNLIENAVRHSPPGGIVRLTAASMPRCVQLSVADEGPGVDPASAEQLFEPFRSGSIPGASGVGLAICRAIIDAHGGAIRFARPPVGAEVIVELPC